MSKLKIKEGTTSKLVKIRIVDSSSTTESGLTGLTWNSAGLIWNWIAEGDSTTTNVNIVNAILGSYTSGGFVEVNSITMPGVYEIGIPNECIDATSEGSVSMVLLGATDMKVVPIELELDRIDYRDSVRAGLLSLPNAAADAPGGIPVSSTGGLNMDILQTVLTDTETTIPGLINGLNQSASRRITIATSVAMEVPDSGTADYQLQLRCYNESGELVNATSTPTLVVTGNSGDLSSNLSVVVNPTTGVYNWTYTVSSTDTLEQILVDVSATLTDGTFTGRAFSVITNAVAVDFTASDRAMLVNVLNDTDELQTNQAQWVTPTGFSTHSAADVWAHVTRTLSTGVVVSDYDSGKQPVLVGVEYSWENTGVGDHSGEAEEITIAEIT